MSTTMSSASDPLNALKVAINSKSPVTYSKAGQPVTSLASATHIDLSPSFSAPKSTATRYRKPGTSSTDPVVRPDDFFTLEAVYLAWSLRQAAGAEYMRQARENGLTLGFVSITERKSVVDWLEGRIADADNDRVVPLAGVYSTRVETLYDALC